MMEHRLTWNFTERSGTGRRVLYWMQASVRVRDNLALVVAHGEATSRGLPLEVLFCLDPSYPEANARSFAYLLDGLEDVAEELANRGLPLTIALGPATEIVPRAAQDAALVVFDRGYLPFARRTRWTIAQNLSCPVVMAEDNVSVPVATVSQKEEWAAATLRPKLMRLAGLEPALPRLSDQGNPPHSLKLAESLANQNVTVLPNRPNRTWIRDLGVDTSVSPPEERGGETKAWNRWESFRDGGLWKYNDDRNDPNRAGTSGLAPALHFGHLTPMSIIQDLKDRGYWKEPTSYRAAGEDSVSKFLDEILVRRELSINYVFHQPSFDRWEGLPSWARKTLEEHRHDRREFVYDGKVWESAATHDPAWNAAQTELLTKGQIHGTMRMYWGKKLLEWSRTPEEGFQTALFLNNRYALDGRDPNSYAGVAWCFGKHDRPWAERSIFGMVRSMTVGGLRKKFDLDAYVRRFTRQNEGSQAQAEFPTEDFRHR